MNKAEKVNNTGRRDNMKWTFPVFQIRHCASSRQTVRVIDWRDIQRADCRGSTHWFFNLFPTNHILHNSGTVCPWPCVKWGSLTILTLRDFGNPIRQFKLYLFWISCLIMLLSSESPVPPKRDVNRHCDVKYPEVYLRWTTPLADIRHSCLFSSQALHQVLI